VWILSPPIADLHIKFLVERRPKRVKRGPTLRGLARRRAKAWRGGLKLREGGLKYETEAYDKNRGSISPCRRCNVPVQV
jgi:hypothetical protein